MFSEDKTKVALIRKVKKEKLEFMEGLLNGIGGKIEDKDNNNWLLAMIREFKEEAGLETKRGGWKNFCRLSGQSDKHGCKWIVYFCVAFGDLSKLKSMEEEQIEIVDVSNINNEKIVSNLKWLIPMALSKDDIYAEMVERV